MRMMYTVLVEPRDDQAPTKRKRAGAKRTDPKNKTLGNIRNYFSELYTSKEWSTSSQKEGGELGGTRKRKDKDCLEPEEHMACPKSRRLLVEATVTSGTTNSRTKCPFILGENPEVRGSH